MRIQAIPATSNSQGNRRRAHRAVRTRLRWRSITTFCPVGAAWFDGARYPAGLGVVSTVTGDGDEPERTQRRLRRAWMAPMRAMTRILNGDELPPASVATAGGPADPVIDCAVYVDGHRQPGKLPYPDAAEGIRDKGGFVWLELHQPDEAGFAPIARTFGLHELAAEQAVVVGHRPKIERYADLTLFALRTTRYVEHQELTETSEVVESGEVLIFVGGWFVITVRHGAQDVLAGVRADLEQRPDLLRHGPWSVAHAVCDTLVDSYLDVAIAVETDIEDLEELVFSRDARSRIANIYQLKRELMEFRRAVAPLQRPLARLIDDDGVLSTGIRRYFRDVNDHLIRTIERVMAHDELLNSILQARLAQVSVDQNNDMRKIAAWAAIAATQTAIAGIYGMNFAYMPELGTRYGYPIILGVMLVSAVALYRLFRRSGWL
jgi:magnesium transporter